MQLEKINALYKPLQPTIKSDGKKVSYVECKPDPALKDIIYCYWQLKTQEPLEDEFTYRVVADGCIDIFFDVTDTSESFVMGFCKEYTEFPLETSFNYVGIRFYPSMFPQVFNVNAREISNAVFPLSQVVPVMSNFLRNKLEDDLPFARIVKSLDEYLGALVESVAFNFDKRFYGAIYIILQNFGVVETEKDLDTGISPRQLRRLFDYYIGTSPKTFCKIIRFQNILSAKPSLQSLGKSKIFYDRGYADQAHFIREFKALYGVTPARAMG